MTIAYEWEGEGVNGIIVIFLLFLTYSIVLASIPRLVHIHIRCLVMYGRVGMFLARLETPLGRIPEQVLQG